MDVRSRRVRETSPDRAKVCLRPRVKPLVKKVQVVYYLSRNGHLEHPHYMEVAHLADQSLRLRDVMERLTILRGKGMPSLYSWSCKRSYKNGYVWNDLAENDIIHPTEGAEYVLKGSELVEGCSEKFQQIQISSTRQQRQQHHIEELNFQTRQKPKYEEDRDYDEEEEEQEQEEEEEYEVELDEDQKTSYTSSTTPHSRCSRGVSTDELEESQAHKPPSEPITTPPKPSSDDSQSIMTTANKNRAKQINNRSRRFNDNEDADPGVVSEPGPGRNSVLLQLIACGSSAVAKVKSSPPVAVKSSNNSNNGNLLRRGVLCKSAAKMADEEMISYMSENPRFGNPQAEEKEYFSGSIVESMTEERAGAVPPVLKKSNSYNEERSAKAELEEFTHEDEEKREKAKTTGRCIPRKRSSASSKQESKKH